MIDVKNLHKSFGSLQVLRGIDLHVSKGDIISINIPAYSIELKVDEAEIAKRTAREVSIFAAF